MLSHSQHEEYAEQGFLVFDPHIEPAVIDEAAARTRELYLAEGDAPDKSKRIVVYRDSRRIQDAWKVIPAVKAIARAPRVLQLLQELYGRKPLPFQTLNFRVGSEQKTHSDTIHFNSTPPGYMCGVWVALEDIDRHNGPVMYYPGSHKWSEITLADVDAFGAQPGTPAGLARIKTYLRIFRDTDADYAQYEKLIQHRIEASGTQPVYATIRKGEAFLWAANLLHGGSPQVDRSRTRASQVTHYFFEGCRYYTPLLRRGFLTRWRNPTWIE